MRSFGNFCTLVLITINNYKPILCFSGHTQSWIMPCFHEQLSPDSCPPSMGRDSLCYLSYVSGVEGRGFSCGLMTTTLNCYRIYLIFLLSSSGAHCYCLWWTLWLPQIPSPSNSCVASPGPSWWLLKSCIFDPSVQSFSLCKATRGTRMQMTTMPWDPCRSTHKELLPISLKLHNG